MLQLATIHHFNAFKTLLKNPHNEADEKMQILTLPLMHSAFYAQQAPKGEFRSLRHLPGDWFTTYIPDLARVLDLMV